MKKASNLFLLLAALACSSVRAEILFLDATNYPNYTNGCIEGQGQWYCYLPKTPKLDALLTNNVLILNTTNSDSVAAPTNGWSSPTVYNYASFTINVRQLSGSSYFCQFQNINDTNDVCHVFIDTQGTQVPGTYRLGIANYATSFSSVTYAPPVNYPMDLATNINYTVVILFDTSGNPIDNLVGGTLWINPSERDFQNAAGADYVDPINDPGLGYGFVYAVDNTTVSSLQNIQISQIGFSPYADAGISNVIVATTFDEVNSTNLPVFGIQPQSGTNYSGNTAVFETVASGVDLTYQWYSAAHGLLTDDGVNIVGSTSNILVLNNLAATDSYYVVATDAYGNTATSATAAETVLTAQTAPFFPASVTAVNLTNNLFAYSGFTNIALGTGPLYYQWYFAPTNTPNTFAPLAGQTGPGLSLDLLDGTYNGNYFVLVSNTVNGGSIAVGPTNSLTEVAPVMATILQLHNYLIATTNQLKAKATSYYYINSNNVTVGGYVTSYAAATNSVPWGGFGNGYSEFFIEDALGYGVEVYVGGVVNTNTPPVGSYVTVSGPLEVYHAGLEITPASLSAVTVSSAPAVAITPKLSNADFNDLATNFFGTNALLSSCALVTFTNVYIYGNTTGGAIGTGGSHSGVGGIFLSNSYTALYFTIGQYNSLTNTNCIEIYQYAQNYGPGAAPIALNAFGTTFTNIPTHCYQITGTYLAYGTTPEIEPTRPADYVINPPPSFITTGTRTNIVVGKNHVAAFNVNWPSQPGSTYSVDSATTLTGPWTLVASGLTYYPTNGTFLDTNAAPAKFYRVTSP